MNANEQAIYDACRFLLDNRAELKMGLSPAQCTRMDGVLRQLATSIEKGGIDDTKPWAGTFKSQEQYRKERI